MDRGRPEECIAETLGRIRARAEQRHGAEPFDKRPGQLEATRGLGAGLAGRPVYAVGCRLFGPEGQTTWGVLLVRDGHEIAWLDPDAAVQLAGAIEQMADCCAHGNAGDAAGAVKK